MIGEVHQPIENDPDPLARRARELGIDLGLIAENLRMSPAGRMRQHDRCVRQVLAIQERLGVASLNEA